MLSAKVLSRLSMLIIAGAVAGACGGEGEEGAETGPAAETPAATPAAEAGGTAPPAAPGAPATGTPATGALPAGVTPEMVQQGQQIFTTNGNCFTCHGPNAQGTPLAPNLTDAQWIWVQPGPNLQQELMTLIKTGVATPKEYPAPMPAMGGASLSDEQLQAVTAYVISIAPGQGG